MSCEKDFSALVATHASWLSAFLRGLTRTDADAEDAFQDVWLRVFKREGRESVTSMRAYLACVARSVVIDRYRRDGQGDLMFIPTDGADDLLEDDAQIPSVRVEARATHEEVLAAVRTLPAGPRQVVLMRIEGEMTFQEIADALKIPLGTALTWMRTATIRLKKLLGER